MKTVKIRPLKQFAFGNFPMDSHLRDLTLAEKDTLKADKFLTLMDTWMWLFRLEMKSKWQPGFVQKTIDN